MPNPNKKFVRAVFDEYHEELHRYLLSRLRGRALDASDVAQETYLRLLRMKDSDAVRQPHAYVYRVATNVMRELGLKERTQEQLPELLADPSMQRGPAETPDTTVERQIRVRHLERALRGLPSKTQAILLLKKARRSHPAGDCPQTRHLRAHRQKTSSQSRCVVPGARIARSGVRQMIDSFRSAREAIQADAAEWVLRLDEDALPAATRSELLKWLKESPQHVEEFLFASAAWRELDDVDAGRALDVDALIAAATDNVVALANTRSGEEAVPPTPGRRAWWFGGIAAAVLVAVAVAWIWPSANSIQHYKTDLGQQTLFTLADGSIVHLNTQSELTVRMQSDSRVLHLRRGEAMFNVAKDPERPFRVVSGDVTVEAIGTQFNVYRREDGVHVTVVEGTVKVEPALPAAQPEQAVAGRHLDGRSGGTLAAYG